MIVPSWRESTVKDTLEYVPRILFKLLVTQAQTAVFFIDFQYLNLDFCSDLRKFRRVLDFLRPRKVGDMNQTVYAFFDLDEYTEVCKVTYFGMMTRTDSIFLSMFSQGSAFQLFDAERHFTFFTVKSQITTASTSSPTFMKSCALRKCCVQDISETWIRPSTPGAISMNAP